MFFPQFQKTSMEPPPVFCRMYRDICKAIRPAFKHPSDPHHLIGPAFAFAFLLAALHRFVQYADLLLIQGTLLPVRLMHMIQIERVAQGIVIHLTFYAIDELERFQRKSLVKKHALVRDPR